jgi:hypothetical protein
MEGSRLVGRESGLEYANNLSLNQYGSRLVEVVTEKLRQKDDLEVQFITLLKERYEENKEAVRRIFLEFTRKLCNTRIQEFLDTYRQIAAKDDSASTLSGQNLRDKLLTYHVNPRSE